MAVVLPYTLPGSTVQGPCQELEQRGSKKELEQRASKKYSKTSFGTVGSIDENSSCWQPSWNLAQMRSGRETPPLPPDTGSGEPRGSPAALPVSAEGSTATGRLRLSRISRKASSSMQASSRGSVSEDNCTVHTTSNRSTWRSARSTARFSGSAWQHCHGASNRGAASSASQGTSRTHVSSTQSQELQVLRQLVDERERREEELIQRHISNRGPGLGNIRGSNWFGKARPRPSSSSSYRDLMTPTQVMVDSVVSSRLFDPLFIGATICLNAFAVGLEADYEAKGLAAPSWVNYSKYVFAGIYFAELSMRVFIHKSCVLQSGWVKLDMFTVACGILDVILHHADGPGVVGAIQLLRLARLAKMLRLLVQFKLLWQLVQGLMHSALAMLWTFLVLILLIYCFAVLGLWLFRHDEEAGDAYNDAIEDNHLNKGLGMMMLSLFRFVTLDDIGGLYENIIREKPSYTLYFAALFLFVPVALMNLVTAFMVESAQTQSAEDREAEMAWFTANRRKAIPRLKAIFWELDSDNDGVLQIEDLMDAPEEIKEQLTQISRMEDCEELFHTLDFNHNGQVEVEEFCDGILKVAEDSKHPELQRLARQCRAIQENVKVLLQLLQDKVRLCSKEDKKGNGPAGLLFRGEDRALSRNFSRRFSAISAESVPEEAAGPTLTVRVGTMERRLSGVEMRLSGMEGMLRSIASAVVKTDGAAGPTVVESC